MQLELFEWAALSPYEKVSAFRAIRNQYWHLRNLRKSYDSARIRGIYRRIASEKKRLQLAGVEKREILDLLRCCRLRCEAHKHPFKPCKYCP